MNVVDKYREWTVDLIKEDVKKNTFPYAVLMSHIDGDMNLATTIRNANAFGAKEVFYFGKKHVDKRGCVGTHNYTQLTYLKDFAEVLRLKAQYSFVAMENNHPNTQPLTNFNWPENPLLIFGEECRGISTELLASSDYIVNIPQYGSVRSLNVGTASGIAMNSLVNHIHGFRLTRI